MSSRLADTEAEIKRIFEDAEAKANPLRSKVERLKIAIEEIQEAGHSDNVTDGKEAPKTSGVLITPTSPISAKQLILNELNRSNQPMTKLEFVASFEGAGHKVNSATVGSTLSILRSDGVLKKDAMNRYNLKGNLPK